ncbi:MAG: hypothetical protein H0X12_06435 [Nocardioides sp.]|nr:hypothetical protein [Nocardioides sp.]
MSFQVQSETLRTHAKLWAGHATDVQSAQTTVSPGIGMGDDFGYLAGLNGVADNYNTWSHAMDQALTDAANCFKYLDAALNSAANEYDDSDATAATNSTQLDKMIGE